MKAYVIATLLALPVLAQADSNPVVVPVITPRGGMNGSGGCPGHGFPRQHILYFGEYPLVPAYEKKHRIECKVTQVNEDASEVVLHNWSTCNPEAGLRFMAPDGCATYKAQSRAVTRNWSSDGSFTDAFGPIAHDEITYYAD